MRLTPLFGPALPTRAERLPVDQLKVPKGFRIEVFASGIPNARTLRVGDKGTVFVGSRLSDLPGRRTRLLPWRRQRR